MKILQLSVHFRPNIGGVETHLDDLVNALVKRKWLVTVLTYRPLTTKAGWKFYESSEGVSIIRIPWVPNLFYTLISYPFLEFLYLFPGLFITTPAVLLLKNPDVIHAHGLVAGFVGMFWGKLFGKKVIISTHSIYNFPKKGIYKSFASWIFKNANYCLGLSRQEVYEILSLGINKLKVKKFTYWIDLEKFKRVENAKAKLGWEGDFVVLFVGRLIAEKGLEELLESAKNWVDVKLVIIGFGPLENKIKGSTENIEYKGVVNQDNLPIYYSGADVLIVPSTSEEGFGRVILESLACGTPVIGANRGAISEAINDSVGKLIDVSPENIKRTVEYFYTHRDRLAQLAKKCRNFAERRYSEKNVETIINVYN
ncbi:MAG: glycosyltransferase family 4 protein [Patescibacteria group bacterium]